MHYDRAATATSTADLAGPPAELAPEPLMLIGASTG
jgi:hypothetical protein